MRNIRVYYRFILITTVFCLMVLLTPVLINVSVNAAGLGEQCCGNSDCTSPNVPCGNLGDSCSTVHCGGSHNCNATPKVYGYCTESWGHCDAVGSCVSDGGGCQETNNIDPSAPSVQVCVDGACFSPSLDPNNPSIILRPTTSITIKASASPPPGSNGMVYLYRVDNQLTGFSCANSDDYCLNDDSNWVTQTETPNIINELGINYGVSYHIWVYSGSKNKCNNDVRTNDPNSITHAYFRINNPPTVTSVTPVPANGSTFQCSYNSALVGWSGRLGQSGVDNPVSFQIKLQDLDRDMNRLFFAIAPDATDDIVDGGCGDWENSLRDYFAIVVYINTDGTVDHYSIVDAVNSPSSGCPWIDSSSIGKRGKRFSVGTVSTSRNGSNFYVTIPIQFENNFITGNYRYYTMGNDSFLNAVTGSYSTQTTNTVDPDYYDWAKRTRTWSVDNDLPVVEGTATLNLDKVNVSWNISDVGSNLRTVTHNWLGMPSYLFWIDGPFSADYDPAVSSTMGSETLQISVDDVPSSGIDIIGLRKDVTDSACNTSSDSVLQSFAWKGPWFKTKWGDLYSSSGVIQDMPDNDGNPSTLDERLSSYTCLTNNGSFDLGSGGCSLQNFNDNNFWTIQINNTKLENSVNAEFIKIKSKLDAKFINGGDTFQDGNIYGYKDKNLNDIGLVNDMYIDKNIVLYETNGMTIGRNLRYSPTCVTDKDCSLLIVVDGNVTINADVEHIDAFIISSGKVTVNSN